MNVLRPKTIATALLLILLAGSPASGQQYDRGRVPLPVPRVTLNASPASVTPGRPVTFVAQLSSGYPNIRFRFVFDDGSQTNWQSTPVATHAYQTAGNYKPFVDIGVATGGGVTRLGGSVRRLVDVTHPPAGPVDLIVNPATAQPGRTVTLMARTGANNPNLRYRFSFGDGSPLGGWQTNSQASHVYSKSGTFTASAEVATITNRGIQKQGTSHRRITVSAPVALRVVRPTPSTSSTSHKGTRGGTRAKTMSSGTQKGTTTKAAPIGTPSPAIPSPTLSPKDATGRSGFGQPTGSNDWRSLWLLVPLTLLVVILGRWIFGRPAVVGHPDPGSSSVVDSTGLVSKAAVLTPASASKSEQAVSSSGPLVKNVRREDG